MSESLTPRQYGPVSSAESQCQYLNQLEKDITGKAHTWHTEKKGREVKVSSEGLTEGQAKKLKDTIAQACFEVRQEMDGRHASLAKTPPTFLKDEIKVEKGGDNQYHVNINSTFLPEYFHKGGA